MKYHITHVTCNYADGNRSSMMFDDYTDNIEEFRNRIHAIVQSVSVNLNYEECE